MSEKTSTEYSPQRTAAAAENINIGEGYTVAFGQAETSNLMLSAKARQRARDQVPHAKGRAYPDCPSRGLPCWAKGDAVPLFLNTAELAPGGIHSPHLEPLPTASPAAPPGSEPPGQPVILVTWPLS